MAVTNKITKSRLHAIAECLDIPVETFFDPALTHEAKELNELFLICLSLKTSVGRAAALAALHQILDHEDDP